MKHSMKKHTQITMQLKELLDCDERLKRLVEQSICLAAEENPDPVKNPVRSLEQFYDFISLNSWKRNLNSDRLCSSLSRSITG